MTKLCRCPDQCGMEVYGARWYAWKCPWLAAQMVLRKAHKAAYNLRYRQQHTRKPLTDRAKVNKQTYDRRDRWLGEDDPPDVIEAKYQRALAEIRWRRKKAQAA
jgi:hypothetical protein